jgi:hypothetical protein
MDAYDKENQRLYVSNPSLFKKGTPQNKRFIADFLKNNLDYNKLNPVQKIEARTKHMTALEEESLKNPNIYGENPSGFTPLEPDKKSVPVEPLVGLENLQK